MFSAKYWSGTCRIFLVSLLLTPNASAAQNEPSPTPETPIQETITPETASAEKSANETKSSAMVSEATTDNQTSLQTPASREALSTLLTGTQFPLSLKLKQLDAKWRRVRIRGQQLTASQNNATLSEIAPESYYTRGEMVDLGGETYLVAYHVPLVETPTAAQKPALTAESDLELALLNLRVIGSMSQLRPFDLAQETAVVPPVPDVKQINAQTDERLKLLGTALQQYIQDWDELLPPFDSTTAVHQALKPYSRAAGNFYHPQTGLPFLPNAILSRKKLAHITNPAAIVAFYEEPAAADGTRGLLFLSGRVKRIHEKEWPQVIKASKIPITQRQTLGGNAVAPETMTSISVAPDVVASPQNALPPQPNIAPTTLHQTTPAAHPSLSLGAPLLGFQVNDVEGKAVSLDNYRDKVLYLHFWGLWSQPSRADALAIATVHRQWQARGFDVLSVALDDAEERVPLLQFVQQNSLNWRHIHDGQGWNSPLAKAYNVRSIPFSILLDKRGHIIAMNVRGDELDAALRQALDTKPQDQRPETQQPQAEQSTLTP
jgi:hypothetical protein